MTFEQALIRNLKFIPLCVFVVILAWNVVWLLKIFL